MKKIWNQVQQIVRLLCGGAMRQPAGRLNGFLTEYNIFWNDRVHGCLDGKAILAFADCEQLVVQQIGVGHSFVSGAAPDTLTKWAFLRRIC